MSTGQLDPPLRRVLVVDDDPDIRSLVTDALRPGGFEVEAAGSAHDALQRLAQRRPAIVLLDLGLGDGDGLDLLRHAGAIDVPAIVVSGRTSEGDRVACLEMGADDYISKPVSTRELVARVRAVLRRTEGHPGVGNGETRTFGDLTVDGWSKEASFAGRPLDLTAKEFALLDFLTGSPRRVFSGTQLLEALWGSSAWVSAGTVREHIHRIRKKLRAAGAGDGWIVGVRGVGYRFEPSP